MQYKLDYYYVEEIFESSELPEFNVTFNVEPYWLKRSTSNPSPMTI